MNENEKLLDAVRVFTSDPEPEQAQPADEDFGIEIGQAANPTLTKYLYYPYIPRGNIVCLYGKQGIGKGYAAAAIGAEISNGTRPLEYERRTPETVLVISTEETAGDIERKFRYSGADMDKIARIGSEKAYRDGRPRFNLAERPQELASAIRKVSAGLVIIDPVQDFLGVKNLNAAEEVGGALLNLMNVAASCDCSIIFLAHPSKKDYDGDLLSNVAGSAEFTRKPRSVIYIGWDDTGENPCRRVLVHAKHNGTIEGTALAMEIHTVDEDDIVEEITIETAPPAFAQIVGEADGVTADIVASAAAHRKKLHEYLAEIQTSAPDKIDNAATVLANLADKLNLNPLLLSKKGLVDHFPNPFKYAPLTTIVSKVKPKLYKRGYSIELVKPIGQGRKDYYGYENQRCVKIVKVKG